MLKNKNHWTSEPQKKFTGSYKEKSVESEKVLQLTIIFTPLRDKQPFIGRYKLQI